MSWSVLQSFKGQDSGAGTITATPGSSLTSGSKLIAAVQVLNTTGGTSVTVTGVSDDSSNSFTRVRNAGAGGYPEDYPDGGFWLNCYVYVLDTPAGDAGTTPEITVTLSGSGAIGRVLIQEVSGLAAGTAALDGIPAGAGGSNYWSSSDYSAVMPYYVTSAAGEYLMMLYADRDHTWTAPSGWTADSNSVNSDSTYGNLAVAYKSSAGALESGTWTVAAGGVQSNWGLIAIAFRLAGNGVTVTPPGTIAYQSSAITTTAQPFAYADPQITSTTAGAQTSGAAVPTVNQNVYGAISGETQSLTAYSPHNWSVTANITDPGGLSSSVHCFPNVGWYYDGILWQNAWSQWYTGWNVTMPENNDELVVSACYDLWPDSGDGIHMNEVMFHYSLINRGGGTYQYTDVQFGGYYIGAQYIPVTYWGVLTGGQTVYFNQMDGYGNLHSSSAGWVSLYEAWTWLTTHVNADTGEPFLLPGTAVGVSTGFSAGFEFCNTGGVNETAAYNDFWCYVIPAPAGHAGASRRMRR